MANTVDKVIAVAKAEVGYCEKRNGNVAYLYDKTANAGDANYTKYGYEMNKLYPKVMDYPAYWCDCFVDWCFYKAYGTSNAKMLIGGDFDDYTVNSAQLYKNKGAYYKSNPQVGDQIFFNNGTRICHTGLVYDVSNGYVYTIEGNTSGGSTVVANGGSVAMKKYALSYAKIDGYGRPKYDTKETATSKSEAATTTSKKPVVPVGILVKGTTSPQVKQLQKCLNYTMKAGLVEDGEFGDATRKALIKFQNYWKIEADGIYGNTSRSYMSRMLERKVPNIAPASPVLKVGSKGTSVKKLQKDLNFVINAGLTVDADFGTATEEALKNFQKEYDLKVTGQYGAADKKVMKVYLTY